MVKLLLVPALPLALVLAPALPDPDPDPRGKGYLGVQITGTDNRVVVQDVVADGPSARAGLRAGDVLLKVEGTEVRDVAETIRLVSQKKPGTILALAIERDGQKREVRVKIGSRPVDLDPPPIELPPPRDKPK